MSISEVINEYGRLHSPYTKDLVNHLPMVQLALFKLCGDLDKVKEYTEDYIKKVEIDFVKTDYPIVNSINECLGNRELYESCLAFIEKEVEKKGIDEVVRDILNTYPLGISSGLFHAIIRVAYAVEGYKTDKDLAEEVARSLAYYITAYREGKVFTREIEGFEIIDEVKALINDPNISKVRNSQNTMGKKLKALYNDEYYLKKGFIIEGIEINKVRFLLNLILTAFINSNDMVILHCITGLHAVVALKDYFDDFNGILDIITSFIITHLLTVDNLDFTNGDNTLVDFSWRNIICMGKDSPDIHTIKLTYSCSELGKTYDTVGLKKAIKKRIFG